MKSLTTASNNRKEVKTVMNAKKILTLVLALTLVFALAAPAFASEVFGTHTPAPTTKPEDQPDPDDLAQEEIISLTKKALGTENATKLAKMLRKDGGYDVLRKHSKDFWDLYNDTVESLADTSNTITAYRIVSEAVSDAQKLFEPEIQIKVTFGDSNIGYDAATGTFNFTFAYVVEYGGDSVIGTTNRISVASINYATAAPTPAPTLIPTAAPTEAPGAGTTGPADQPTATPTDAPANTEGESGNPLDAQTGNAGSVIVMLLAGIATAGILAIAYRKAHSA